MSKMAATSGYDDILPDQVNFCLAVMDTGVNMVAFARMDTCPVSTFSPFFFIFQSLVKELVRQYIYLFMFTFEWLGGMCRRCN